MVLHDAWFAPKRFGWGIGRPISWQGWLLTIVYLATVLSAAHFLFGQPIVLLSIVASATALVLVVAARRTRGGLRWRWNGERDD